jgi:integrase
MQTNSANQKTWQKSSVANLYYYAPTGIYYARPRIKGKVKVKCLKTDKLTVAKQRLADFLREEHRKAEAMDNTTRGKLKFGDAAETFKSRLMARKDLKPRSKDYRLERLQALLRSWPNLENLDIGKIRKHECQEWSKRFGMDASATAFNNTVGTLRMILDIGIEFGACYDNPAKTIGKHRVRAKQLELPSQAKFLELVTFVESVRVGRTKSCANLIRFLAFGGFRKSEAERVTWADCDFEKELIRVKGDPDTGTKNWEVRNVPMIPEMKTLLEKLRAERPDAKPTDSVMLVRECQGALNSGCKAVGVKRITHHDLRHLFATRCIESGVDIPTVAKWLGHKDRGALAMKVYGHLREEHSVGMAKRVSFATAPVGTTVPTPEIPAANPAAPNRTSRPKTFQ